MKNRDTKYYFLVIVCVALLGCATFSTSVSYSLFYEPMMKAFNASKSEVTLHTSINYFTFGFANPVAARLLKKYKLKNLMIVGVLGVAISSMLEALANSLLVINLLNIIKGITFAGCSVIIMQTILGNWFYRNRSFVIGIVYAICGLSTAVMTPVLASVISKYGYKTGLIFSFSIMIVLALPCIFLCPFSPQEVGMTPYGLDSKENEKSKQFDSYNISFNYFSILVALYVVNSLALSMFTNLSSHINGYAYSLGYDDMRAATVISVYSIGSVLSNIFSGAIIDFLGPMLGTVITTLVSIIGVVLMLVFENVHSILLVGAILFGASAAISSIGTNSILRLIYGNSNYQMVSSNLTMITSPISSISVTLISLLYDINSSYVLPLVLGVIGGIISIIIDVIMVKKAESLSLQ